MAETAKETIEKETARSIKQLSEVERAHMLSRILSYRTAGAEWDAICKSVSKEFNTQLKMTSAWRLYNDYLKQIPRDGLNEARMLSVHRLDRIISKAFLAYENRGSIKALEIAMSANKQMNELLGLDAPAELNVNHSAQISEAAQAFDSEFDVFKKSIIAKAAETAERENTLQ